MGSRKISSLPEKATSTGTEELLISDGGVSRKIKISNVGITPSQTYGVDWNQSTDTYTSTGDHSGLPIQNAMKRCLLNDDGTVGAYLLSTNSSYLSTGEPATLDGSAGQVMVEIPKFYYKKMLVGDIHSYQISFAAQDDFIVHPAFIKNGIEVPHRYFGAYEGYVLGGKLGSVSGQCPATYLTRSEFRSQASSRGAGWRQTDFYLNSAVQLLYLVEYQDFNSQETIGMGRAEMSAGTWTCDSYLGISGKSNGDGNGTNSVAGNTNNAYMTYRGIENWYGNIRTFIDGVNIYYQQYYVSNDDTSFADDTTTGYVSIGTASSSSGYQDTLIDSVGFLPASVEAYSTTKIGDWYAQNSGDCVVLSGGNALNAFGAGVFSLYAYRNSSHWDVNVGSRVAF